MEGKATFTLTDAASGKIIRQFTEHNLVTDAVKRILNPPGNTLMYKFNYSDYIQHMLPLSQTLFGGIMLLGNNMEERADNVMLNKNCIPIATAGGAYAGTNTMRGTLNENESYATANGYHFTWDFGTDKANGTIKCAALTSRVFGNTGFWFEDKTGSAMIDPINVSTVSNVSTQYMKALGQYVGTFEKNVHTYFKRTLDNTVIEFLKYKSLDPNSIGLNDWMDISGYAEPIATVQVTLPISHNINVRWYIDKDTSVLYFFTGIYNDNGQYKLDYAGISMNDFSIADTGTRKLSCNYSLHLSTALYEDKLFIAGDNRIDIFNSGGEMIASYPYSLTGAPYFFTVNGVLSFVSANTATLSYLNGIFYSTYNPSNYSVMSSVDCDPPYYPFAYVNPYGGTYDVSANPYLGLAANYLATINNLSEPLEKTNEQTLKITYDITH